MCGKNIEYGAERNEMMCIEILNIVQRSLKNVAKNIIYCAERKY